jgi:transposase
VRVRTRIHGLLATHGVRVALTRHFPTTLVQLTTGDGRPFPAALRDRLLREWESLQTLGRRLTTLTALRAERLAHGDDRVAHVARRLHTLRGIGDVAATTFSAELFGTRTFQNRRQLGALTGLVPVPYRSDQRVADQGISKADAARSGCDSVPGAEIGSRRVR